MVLLTQEYSEVKHSIQNLFEYDKYFKNFKAIFGNNNKYIKENIVDIIIILLENLNNNEDIKEIPNNQIKLESLYYLYNYAIDYLFETKRFYLGFKDILLNYFINNINNDSNDNYSNKCYELLNKTINYFIMFDNCDYFIKDLLAKLDDISYYDNLKC